MSITSGKARLDERGRLVLPADFRRRLGLKAGDEVSITEESEGVLRVETRRSAARALVGIAGRGGPSAVDELRAERTREARAEQASFPEDPDAAVQGEA